ncbi:response regulator [Pseudomonas paraversuta]|uniref:response regulator n=1 Tax=Pseudomonas paraversuta TaxID=2750624 RepID=UPI0019348A88|nr:response regulator [Pseudomonas paraversuta]
MMRSLKVLIVDDNPFQLMSLHQMLNAYHIFDVLAADNLESARGSLARRGAIDVAICDLYLEAADALQLIHEMSAKPEAPALIFVGGAESHVLASAVSTARKDGLRVLGYLPKPVTVTGLGLLLDSYQQSRAVAGA